MKEITNEKLNEAREKISCKIELGQPDESENSKPAKPGEILDKHGKPVRLTEMTTAGG